MVMDREAPPWPKSSAAGLASCQGKLTEIEDGRTKGGLNSKLHAACDGASRAVIFLLTEGQVSDQGGELAYRYRMGTIEDESPEVMRFHADPGSPGRR